MQREGYQVSTASDGEEALRLAEREQPDLIILDLMLPRVDGFEVCRRLRAYTNTPIIILSAKGDEVDKVTGFRLGVDDYLTKPFSPTELVLRVKAVLRRTRAKDEGQALRIVYPGLEMDLRTREVKVRGQPVSLTAREFDLLWLMASHPFQVFSREQLFTRIWGEEYLRDENTVTVMIRRLRSKIEQDPDSPAIIVTVWGVGYKFQPPPHVTSNTPQADGAFL